MLMIMMGIVFFFLGGVQANFTNITVSSYVVFFGLLLSCLECNISARACPPAACRPPPRPAPQPTAPRGR